MLMKKIEKHLHIFKEVNPSVQHLALTNCEQLSEGGIVSLLGTEKLSEISSLDLSGSLLSGKESRGDTVIKKINSDLMTESVDLSCTSICPTVAITSKLLISLNLSQNKLKVPFVIETLYACSAL